VAAQLAAAGGAGWVISQGEFGERLADHARRWRLPHHHLAEPWGQPLDLNALRHQLAAHRPAWLWAVACETSVGLRNPVPELLAACAATGTALCLDAVSALGGAPLNLRGVWLASSTSGKALGSLAGLALLLHDGRLAPAGSTPRALDLAAWAGAAGVAGTQPSGAVAALDAALSIDWPARWEAIAAADARLRAGLAAVGLAPLLAPPGAQPGVLTLALPGGVCSLRLGRRLERQGLALGYESAYLRQRGWVQACLMGEVGGAAGAVPDLALELLPGLMHREIARQIAALPRGGPPTVQAH
jgi:aspartate aminotransferase-like enzyme